MLIHWPLQVHFKIHKKLCERSRTTTIDYEEKTYHTGQMGIAIRESF